MVDEIATPVGTIYTTIALKAFLTLTGLTADQFLFGIDNTTTGNGIKITLKDLIASMVSADAGNVLAIGTDDKLNSSITSVADDIVSADAGNVLAIGTDNLLNASILDISADILSSNSNNILTLGADDKLFVDGNIDFDTLVDTAKVIFGNTEYGGTVATNLNTINKTGFYTCYETAAGVPNSSSSWFVLHQNSNTGTISATQRAMSYSTTIKIYERIKSSSTWGSWVLVPISAEDLKATIGEVSASNTGVVTPAQKAAWDTASAGSGLVLVSDVDAVAGYLEDKLVAGAGIALTKTDSGSIEGLMISNDFSVDSQIDMAEGVLLVYFPSIASYANKNFSVASQESIPRGLFFSPDGLKMFVVGDNTNAVYQYTLSTAFDVSTASYANKNFSVAGQEASPRGLFFSPDGLKMFVVGWTNNIYQYTLSTAFDVSTANYANKNFSVAGQTTAPAGLFFSPDGLKMFVAGDDNSVVYQYTLSTAFDVSTASYANKNLSAAGQDNYLAGLFFSPDGLKMFVAGTTNVTVYQYTVSGVCRKIEFGYDKCSILIGNDVTPINIPAVGTFVVVTSSKLVNTDASYFTWNNGIGTCIKAGYYDVEYMLSARCTLTASQIICCCIMKNGNPVDYTQSTTFNATSAAACLAANKTRINLAVGDTIALGMTNFSSTSALRLANGSFVVSKGV